MSQQASGPDQQVQSPANAAQSAARAEDLAGVPDAALVDAYLVGDQAAFEALYLRHKGPLYRYLLRQLPKPQAEEAFQETWLKIIKGLPTYQNQGKLQSFLFRICHNVLMDQYRAGMREVSVDDSDVDVDGDVADDSQDVLAGLSNSQLQEKLQEQLARLPVAQRAAWMLKHETQLSVQEIAELTDTTAQGVKSRLRYATNKLKQRMRKYV